MRPDRNSRPPSKARSRRNGPANRPRGSRRDEPAKPGRPGKAARTRSRTRSSRCFDSPAQKSFRRNLLVRGIAYQMQVEVYGGLSTATKRRLREIAEAVRHGTFDAADVGPRIKPGTKLVRSWKDEVHTVLAVEEGFEWKGARYR